ncbi:MAG: PA2169 family four-helix-bundle protein [Rhizobacter sp.]|nr:PA2169 family four-helix-bundle protein [Rhizobacter sp.]
MKHDDITETLNDLIETSKDGELGFTACAKHVASTDLQQLFSNRAAECRAAASELQAMVSDYGGKPETDGSTTGALHRGWVAVRGSLVGYSDEAMLEECERGEDAALGRYRAALRSEGLPEAVRAVIARQQLGVQANHDQIKRLRDIARAA